MAILIFLLLPFAVSSSEQRVKIGVGSFSGCICRVRCISHVDNRLHFSGVNQRFTTLSITPEEEQNAVESKAQKKFYEYLNQQLADVKQIEQPDATISVPKKLNFDFDTNKFLSLPIIGKWLTGSDTIETKSKSDVSVLPNPNFSHSKNTDVLNLYQSKETLNKAGVRGNGDFGAGFDTQNNILYNLIRTLNGFDANFNLRKGLDLTFQKGVDGFYTESDITNVNPLGLSFGNQKKICIAEFLIKGLCVETRQGFNQKK